MIRGNTERIQRTIQGLRSLSHDASGDPFQKTPVANIILNTVELCQERFRLNSIDIRNETPGPNVAIECRPSQISQVILNLLNNSFDAVKELPEKWIKLTVTDRKECVEIAVEDSGWGIPKETADRLFVPFFTTKSAQRGLGLGLSISHAIIDAHHGEMILDSSCSHTRFLVRLPKRQPSSAAGALDTAQEEG
jgi:C4-dicarboxylate-specific signal transduction histidine kinase